MNYWVIYDISNDRIRNHIAIICKNYGLTRVQKSAFVGELSRNKAEMLASEIRDVLTNENDAVFFIPACGECMRHKIIIGSFNEAAYDRDFYVVG